MTRRWRQVAVIAALAAILFFLMRQASGLDALWLALLSAYLLAPLVDRLAARGCVRPLAVTLVFVLVAIGLVLIGFLVLPYWFSELRTLAREAPSYTRVFQLWLDHVHGIYRRAPLPIELRHALDRDMLSAQNNLMSSVARAIRNVPIWLSHLVNLVLAPVIAFFLLVHAPRYRATALRLFPPNWRSRVQDVAQEIDQVLAGFIRGQLLVAIVVGALVAIVMLLFHLKYVVLVATLSGVADLIPYFGPFIGALPALAIALMRSPQTAVWVGLSFIAVHLLEGSLITPKIVGRGVGLSPLGVILALILGDHMLGILGMFVAVPVLGVMLVLWRHAWGLLSRPMRRV